MDNTCPGFYLARIIQIIGISQKTPLGCIFILIEGNPIYGVPILDNIFLVTGLTRSSGVLRLHLRLLGLLKINVQRGSHMAPLLR